MATCLYKPKPCESCGAIIPVGAECEYVAETKGVRHYKCAPKEEPPTREQFDLAARLGFIGPDALLPFESWRTHKIEEEKPRQTRLQL